MPLPLLGKGVPFFIRKDELMENRTLRTIRNMDSGGRIVIPPDIRRELHIELTDPLTISVSRNAIIIEKYQQLLQLKNLCQTYLNAFSAVCSYPCVICSNDYVIASKNISVSEEHPLSPDVRQLIQLQKTYEYSETLPVSLFPSGHFPVGALYPIGTPGNPLGAVILFEGSVQKKDQLACGKMLAAIITNIIQKY